MTFGCGRHLFQVVDIFDVGDFCPRSSFAGFGRAILIDVGESGRFELTSLAADD